jgi:glutamine amidotransferase
MISILDIDHLHSVELSNFIKQITENFNITLSELDLLHSSKIIISFSGSIQKAMRKIHLMNLFSVLRMLNNKPILGINSGSYLMCEKVDKTACLGIIPYMNLETENYSGIELSGNYYEITKTENDPILKGLEDSSEFYFDQLQLLSKNFYTTSVLKVNPNISTSFRKDNFFGIQFLPQKSGENGIKLIKNFIEL